MKNIKTIKYILKRSENLNTEMLFSVTLGILVERSYFTILI